jgi:hypothetical protein
MSYIERAMIKAMKKRAAGKYLGRSEAIVKAKDYGIHCGEFQPAEALDGTKIHSLAEFVIDTEG